MVDKSSKEKLEDAKKIYYLDAFRAHMRGMQVFTDDDFEKITPVIKAKIINSKETSPLEMFKKILNKISLEWKKPTNVLTKCESKSSYIYCGLYIRES